ncbi:uncharacterized protein LOC116200097 [Punica granatum]|uniref:Uncharacterized protein n=2 Tax=Punica granatum TaxID=22663 RepID=A0A218X0E5_PUNGR|nr:uncharacterized protein LOC116200097 [Punica granatum]OWM78110.1 hypothetical protein CDL15_Pgr014929 [Punica granatum]PKI79302.1 hypothetical protein CRG98_000316 [Punica granatum]
MAPHGDAIGDNSFPRVTTTTKLSKPPRLSSDNLQRTRSDISFELSRVGEEIEDLKDGHHDNQLPPISEVEDTKCECCGMSEECTPEYIEKVRNKFSGKWLCGLCSEAVKEEVEKNGGKSLEEALRVHMNACAKFKRIRAFPALAQADAMRQILKRSSSRAKSLSPRDMTKDAPGRKLAKPGIARSSSCIADISRDLKYIKLAN